MDTKIGLANLGNTCFLNVILQALRLSPAIGDMFLKFPTREPVLRKDSKKGEFVVEFRTLMLDFWRKAPAIGPTPSMIPRRFMSELHRTIRDSGEDWYHPGQQSDAAEALQYVLDSLHNGMSRRVAMDVIGDASTPEETSHTQAIRSWGTFFAKEYSPIVNFFYGQVQIRIVCSTCGTSSERYEPWLMLKAPIPGASRGSLTLHTCLDAMFADEIIDDYDCDTCGGKHKATIRTKISRLPPVTIVTMKRFTNSGQKLRGHITWDVNSFDFAPWLAFRRDPFSGDEAPLSEYVTYAVVEHLGSTRGGHYQMYARQGEVWNEYDDSSVRSVDPERVVTSDSYIAIMLPKKHAESMNLRNEEWIQKFRKGIVEEV